MAQLEIRSTRWRWKGSIVPRLVALIGVVSPILCVLVFTLAGFLRPGYSPIHHVISDLGVGPDGWILNTDLCKTPTWRRYGWYLLLTALATFGFLVLPTQIAGSGHIGGFIERAQVIVGFAWSVVIGWRLFTLQPQAA